ncbi:DEAD/DEAH box helicase [Hymenobacter frigidus]|uniref:Type I restriction enzyme endonuclease subunit n=1 Tax=Hymenobacter frigidus TaxID=1524095 RepID=A0ABQ1ZYX6_9BACT|nr:type I restriction endonuclease subunit R [Hymenobacter frigidus]GGH80875.1 DEAD/DEAH box helicase [Hymenobacter frigidus]
MVNEQQIEYGLIGELTRLKYTHRPDIRDNAALERNFREKFQDLNRVKLSDAEFSRLRDEIINPDVFLASKTLRGVNTFRREDGTPLNYTLVNIKEWCKNDFEVVNQLRINTEKSYHRYDVILLINGIPVVQLELKTLEVSARRAMQQIADYKDDAGNGYTNTLLCFMQLFIVSNKSKTLYFSNNRTQHFSFAADEQFLPVYEYADIDNRKPNGLHEFAEQFLSKCTLAETISRYMVLVESEQRLLVMRPYQIYAVKAIVECIRQNRGNGYIWHTTGSGKTLTSFKASTLLKDNPNIEKCLFVVDRKDLDRQTREEFNKFQENCVEENTNTETLVLRLLSTDYADKVIVTTIQKLGLALDASHRKEYKKRLQPLRDKRMVFIFDECHRSQFGDNHQAIVDFFPNAQLFGFTGTPIFEQNATVKQIDGKEKTLQTTEDIFQQRLHAYTITHAIEDDNVLRFHVDHFKPEGKATPKPGTSPTREKVVAAILAKHDAATHQRRFNALLATQSINDAIAYYDLFKQLQDQLAAADPDLRRLNVACVFSPPAEGNKDVQQIQEDLPTEKQDNQQEPEVKKMALKGIITDYNQQYGTNHSIGEFDLYYQDVQQRIKDQKWPLADFKHPKRIDITIVVDMLLTGFDSKYLNTLYVDKNLKHHGLIQAFSRTNRVLNKTKPAGNVLDFRQQQANLNEAITLFSGLKQGEDPKKIWLVEPAEEVVKDYEKAVGELTSFMQRQGLTPEPGQINNLQGDAARGEFVDKFKEVQRLRTQLDQYTDLEEPEKTQVETLLPTDDLRAFRGQYLETARRLREKQGIGRAGDSSVNQLDFEFVLFASAIIDYDYIVGLMAASTEPGRPRKLKMTREQIIDMIRSDAKFQDEADDLTDYYTHLPKDRSYSPDEIRDGYDAFKQVKNATELAEKAARYGLSAETLTAFVANTVSRLILDSDKLREVMAPLNLGWKARAKQENELMADLIPLLKKLAHGRDISGLNAYENHE